jgi:hypothetical protein
MERCEFYDNQTKKDSRDAISKISNKDISSRTYYNYKKQLYDKDIYIKLKDTMYDTKEVKCLLLEMEETNKHESLKAANLIADKFLDIKYHFYNGDTQMKEAGKTNDRIKMVDIKFNDNANSEL